MRGALFLLPLLISNAAGAVSWQVYRTNNSGAHKLLDKSFHGAYTDFVTALADEPMNPVVQLNLGLAFELNEEYPKAEQAYQSAAELAKSDPATRFVALFNTGSARGKAKNVDGALAAYQQALELNPNSIETKTNIELLIQSGGGGGGGGQGEGGGQDKKKDQGDGKDQQQQQPRSGDPQNEPPKKQPKPFESKELTPQDVKKILDEIKNQEQSIRAQDYKKGQKESPRGGKDW